MQMGKYTRDKWVTIKDMDSGWWDGKREVFMRDSGATIMQMDRESSNTKETNFKEFLKIMKSFRPDMYLPTNYKYMKDHSKIINTKARANWSKKENMSMKGIFTKDTKTARERLSFRMEISIREISSMESFKG